MKTSYCQLEAYVTKDGSVIRELMHPKLHGEAHISLAEAIIPGGSATMLHRHRQSEEIYHITAGVGIMTLGTEQFTIAPGDTVLIVPGTPHQVQNAQSDPVKILCCCAPAYSHDDTELLAAQELLTPTT
jgi:mannose-6-phosphate isomerase-like protein (cupin superfamily)